MAWVVSPWVRYKVVTIVDLLSRLAGQGSLSLLLCSHFSPLCKLKVSVLSRKSTATAFELEELMDRNTGSGLLSSYQLQVPKAFSINPARLVRSLESLSTPKEF